MEAVSRGDRWTDERLDDLNVKVDDLGRRMDAGFAHVDRRFEQVEQRVAHVEQRMDAGFARIDQRFEGMEKRMDSLHRTITTAAIGLSGAFIAGFGGLAALIATQI